MSLEFMHLNLSNYNASKESISEINSPQNYCICCLNRNSKYINLSTCNHVSFLEFFFKFKVEYLSSVICQHCHYFLKKIELFKQQVEQSSIILNNQAYNSSQSTPFQDLFLSKTLTMTYHTNDEIKNDGFSLTHTDIPKENYSELMTDVKMEHTSTDFETDIPLSEIKQEIEKVKKNKMKRKAVEVDVQPKKRSTIHEKYEGKIDIINLSETEMNEERQKSATKEAYLKLPYKCESCITGFDYELTFQDHMDKRHGDKKGGFVCDICKSVLSTESSYKEHRKRHTRRIELLDISECPRGEPLQQPLNIKRRRVWDPYECKECGKRNSNIYSVIKHYNDQHGTIDTEFTCQDCGFVTGSHRSYRYHRDKHKEKLQCTLCDSTFITNGNLRVHMFTVHKQSSRIYSCERCKKVYNAKSGLVAHMSSVHSNYKGAYCAACRTYFRSTNTLANHLRTHSAHCDRRFICDECGAKFLVKNSLQEHIDYIHLKNNKFQCTKCDKVFINGSALKKHENYVHKKIRPPRNKICDHCGRGFTTLAILRSHVRTHTGERPLHCPHCPATFAHSAALYTHNKLLHTANRGKKRTV